MNTQEITSTPYKFGIGTFKTRDGISATVGAIRPHLTYPMVGWINETMQLRSWTTDGRVLYGEESGHDLMPPEPEMVRVPLEMDDIPQGAEFRMFYENGVVTARCTALFIGPDGVTLGRGSIPMSYETLSKDWEMRAPGGEWVPCWKEVAE